MWSRLYAAGHVAASGAAVFVIALPMAAQCRWFSEEEKKVSALRAAAASGELATRCRSDQPGPPHSPASTLLQRASDGSLNFSKDFRTAATELYEADCQEVPPVTLPSHQRLQEQPAWHNGSGALRLRVAQWNINACMGMYWPGPMQATQLAAKLLELNADVLLFQETVKEMNGWFPGQFGPARQQMAELDKLLQDAGYTILRTPEVNVENPADNPALVAARVPLLDGGGFAMDSPESLALRQQDERRLDESERTEARFGRYVELPLGPYDASPTVGFFAVHFHHVNHYSVSPSKGTRANEVCAALGTWRSRPVATRGKRLATLIATDFNEMRRGDYSPAQLHYLDWYEKRGVDGVHGPDGLLEREGFVDVHDAPCAKLAQRGFCSSDGRPVFTHWTGATVDYTYLHVSEADAVTVCGIYTLPWLLSDHLPTVTDLSIQLSK